MELIYSVAFSIHGMKNPDLYSCRASSKEEALGKIIINHNVNLELVFGFTIICPSLVCDDVLLEIDRFYDGHNKIQTIKHIRDKFCISSLKEAHMLFKDAIKKLEEGDYRYAN